MKKKKILKSPNFDKINVKKLDEKDVMLDILNDPSKLKTVMELCRSAENISKNLQETKTLQDWCEKVLLLLPRDFEDKENFGEKLREFVNDYRSERQAGDNSHGS